MKICFRFTILLISLIYLATSSNFKLSSENSISASLYLENEKFIYKENVYDDKNSLSYCKYSKSLEKLGWDFLALSANDRLDNFQTNSTILYYGMGYLEGIVTKDRIYNHYLNMRAYNWYDYPDRKMPEEVRMFLLDHFSFVESLIMSSTTPEDPFISALSTIFNQYKGLVAGYNSVAKEDEQLDMVEFLNMAAFGDLEDVPMFSKKLREIAFLKKNSTLKERLDYIDKHSHCSVLFKVLPDLSNIFFGHNTWFSYTSMTRIFKEYRYGNSFKSLVFSGYPGTISSIDDFFITSSKLVVTETTNQVYNEALFDSLTPNSLLSWERTMIANLLADDPMAWTKYFSRLNSGTYNNQFMVLDLKKVDTVSRKIEENAFWVLEQIPTLTVANDMTYLLRYGYWPSYNVAFFEEIRELSGINKELKEHPDEKNVIDHSQCARAKIFRRDQSKVSGTQSFKNLMRYNDWENDEFGENRPDFAISARKDLFGDDPQCKGGLDAKIADINSLFAEDGNLRISIISGPTNLRQKSFEFENAPCIKQSPGKYLTNGLINKYEFDWVEYETSLFEK